MKFVYLTLLLPILFACTGHDKKRKDEVQLIFENIEERNDVNRKKLFNSVIANIEHNKDSILPDELDSAHKATIKLIDRIDSSLLTLRGDLKLACENEKIDKLFYRKAKRTYHDPDLLNIIDKSYPGYISPEQYKLEVDNLLEHFKGNSKIENCELRRIEMIMLCDYIYSILNEYFLDLSRYPSIRKTRVRLNNLPIFYISFYLFENRMDF